MERIIRNISEGFLKEAIASPRMFEDLAAMEKYMSESYDGRTFIELLQNADDAQASRVKVFTCGNDLVVANDGRPFNSDDIVAICRSGASSKQRGNNIGYRGVGFKSATSISTEIVIYSADVYFSFSKKMCAQTLGKDEESVPTVRIPFLFSEEQLGQNTLGEIEKHECEGYTTFFVFRNGNLIKFLNEVEEFGASWLLFLNNIVSVEFECGSFRKKCVIKRKQISETDCLIKVLGENEKWYTVSKNGVSLAFKYSDVKGVIPCSADEGVFHCFLPTIDKTGFPFKVNADFSTEPSRKHIIQDDITMEALSSLQRLYVELICRIVKNEEERLYAIVSLLATHTTLNALVTEFENGLLQKLRKTIWVPLNNGQYASAENAKIFPKWLSLDDRKKLISIDASVASDTVKIQVLDEIDKIEIVLSKIGAEEIALKFISQILESIDKVTQLPTKLAGQIFIYCNRMLFQNEKHMSQLFVPIENGWIRLGDTTDNSVLDMEFVDTIKGILNDKELDLLSIQYAAFSVLKKKKMGVLKKTTDPIMGIKDIGKLSINKWKTPVQNCMTVEALEGSVLKTAERKCKEYNLFGTDKNGKDLYIAVKTVGNIGDSFVLTEQEYAASQQYGENYKVYLFSTNTNEVEYLVLNSPLNTIKTKRVVKEWEWLCEDYNSKETFSDSATDINVEINEMDESVITKFDDMDGLQFENFCVRLLRENGYEDVMQTRGSGDQGIDIIAYKDSIKFGIQCKCYGTDIGNSAVQEVYAGKTFYGCHVAIVLTNRKFTPSAIKLAEINGVVLWDRNMLRKLIEKAKY